MNVGPEEVPAAQEHACAPGLQTESESDRQAMPVDAEEAPKLSFPVVGIGASAGGLEAFNQFFRAMPDNSGLAFVLVQHLSPDRESLIDEIVGKYTTMRVQQVQDGMPVDRNHVYVIRPGHTLTIKDGKLHLGERLEKPQHNRPVDDFFKSLAEEQRERAIGIIMSGMGSNGTAGAQAIKAVGGLCIAQDPESAQYPSMPRSLIDAGYADYILRAPDMPDVLIGYAQHPYAREHRESGALPRQEQQHLREILAILRLRTKQDFSGYKKPTVMRRIQRRMGLNRLEDIAKYVKMVRQNPTEATGLSDDLLIHVTGFFRDSDAWEELRRRVIVPMLAERSVGSEIRAWVSACSSGEEAYTLAMLLVEESERLDKPFDIKIFATDMAERSLANARNGTFPGGIEAEITPQRLERFFHKEDALYRVRQDLREKVVFAPQNIIQDPPFSKLDIATCRNLLIYLEPELQQHVLCMLHFGLRDGGFLFLGTSETVNGAEDMFEVVDKKAKIYRRIGPTRHGTMEFPMPRALGHVRGNPPDAPGFARLSVAQLTQKALLLNHVPAAVTVDRDLRIIYYQGNTHPFLDHPTGEPTRDLLSLVNDRIRDSVRSALKQAMQRNTTVRIAERCRHNQHGLGRVVVTVSPLQSPNDREFFVVSFDHRSDPAPLVPPPPAGDGNGADQGELQRIRDELQSTIEQLQSSLEEEKASSEEVMSMNEELQSTNEELETSKEEMQSLNEELATVNAQLQAKIEEHQGLANDLNSLLSSAEIAVIFLDADFRIRRFTPAATKLFELIATDVGRPMSDLARKFTDPELVRDAAMVLDSLTPIEREIRAENGRWFLRRVLPYRTTDNRIEGIVITFIDITRRRAAEESLRQSEASLSSELKVFFQLQQAFSRFVKATDLSSALDDIVKEAVELIGAGTGTLQIIDPQSKEVELAAHCGFDPSIVKQLGTVTRLDRETGARVIKQRKPVVIEDVQQDASYSTLMKAPAAVIRATLSTPLESSRSRIVGVLHTHFDHPHSPSERDLRVMELFARQAADLIERIRDEQELTRLLHAEQTARRALDEAARLKDEFLATLSHELRTPLSAILLWGRMLRESPRGPEEMREGLDAIVTSAQAQTRLIDDLLDTSRIAAGKLRLEVAPTDLRQIIQSAVEAIEPSIDARMQTLRIDVDSRIGLVMVDGERLRQVVWNLLTNAVKFTPASGSITLRATKKDGQVEIRVTDTGVGIVPDFLPYVFDRFRQVEGSSTRKHSGLGLGLTISKQLVELHGGTISAQSAGPNQGATFIIRLPLRSMEKASGPITSARSPVGLASNALRNVSVLLVEDDPGTRDVLSALFNRVGANVTAAESAAVALPLLRQRVPDILISDIAMPETDGYAFIKQVRAGKAGERAKEVPALALSAFARSEDRERALQAGFQLHAAKPVDAEQLIRAVLSLIVKR